MTFDEIQQLLKAGKADVLPVDPLPASDNLIDQQANPSFDEFLTMLMGLRTIRLGRLAIVAPLTAQDNITANFKPTKRLRIYFGVYGKSASTPVYIQFNGDTGTNYCFPSNTSITKINLSNTDNGVNERGIIDIMENEAAKAKTLSWILNRWTGAASASPTSVTGVGGWENTTSQITSAKLSSASGQTFDKGSYLIVYGTD